MDNVIHTETLPAEIAGVDAMFRLSLVADNSAGAPWKECDTMGSVSDWETRGKAPGELLLCEDRGSKRFYDFAGAMKANRQYYANGADCEKAVRADFEYLRRWCNDDWQYVGVVVELLDDEGDPIDGADASLWCVESDAEDYIRKELFGELVSDIEANLPGLRDTLRKKHAAILAKIGG